GPQADIYSLGVVAYQLLSGRLPYEANSLSELALKQQRESPAPLHELNRQVQPELSRAVALALAIDVRTRVGDAMTFAEALRRGAQGQAPLADTAATIHLGSSASTRVLTGGEATAATRMATRSTPPPLSTRGAPPRSRQLEPRRQAAPATDSYASRTTQLDRAAPPRSGRAFRRFIAFLALLLVFAAAVVVAVTIS